MLKSLKKYLLSVFVISVVWSNVFSVTPPGTPPAISDPARRRAGSGVDDTKPFEPHYVDDSFQPAVVDIFRKFLSDCDSRCKELYPTADLEFLEQRQVSCVVSDLASEALLAAEACVREHPRSSAEHAWCSVGMILSHFFATPLDGRLDQWSQFHTCCLMVVETQKVKILCERRGWQARTAR